MSFLSNKIVPWALFPVFVRFDITLVWNFISGLSSMFALCSAIINASSTSSSLKVPLPSPVIFCFLFFLVCMWAILERLAARHQLLDYLFYILVKLSSFAVGFHELIDSKMSTISRWTAVNGHTYTFVIYQSGFWLAPSAGVVCPGLRCREHYLFFHPKGFIRIFVSGSHTSVIAHMLSRLFSL